MGVLLVIVSKDEFKNLKQESREIYLGIAKYTSGQLDITPNIAGNISVRDNGVYFDVLMSKKAFFSFDDIKSVTVFPKKIKIESIHYSKSYVNEFTIEKEKELNKFIEAIASQKRDLLALSDELTNDELRCPECNSQHIDVQKKGFGVGKAAVGALAIGPYGLLAGGIGKNKLQLTCLKCGHKFKPGKA